MRLAAVTAALDALEAGDRRLAEAILFGDPEDAKQTATRSCPQCGLDCQWPGRLADHLRVVHWIEDA